MIVFRRMLPNAALATAGAAKLQSLFARQNGLSPGQMQLHPGSRADFIMIPIDRPGADVTTALATRGVMMGGTRKHRDDWVRVSLPPLGKCRRSRLRCQRCWHDV